MCTARTRAVRDGFSKASPPGDDPEPLITAVHSGAAAQAEARDIA